MLLNEKTASFFMEKLNGKTARLGQARVVTLPNLPNLRDVFSKETC